MIDHSLPNDEVKTITKVLKYTPSQLPFGDNVTVMCETELVSDEIWWTFNNGNITEDNG